MQQEQGESQFVPGDQRGGEKKVTDPSLHDNIEVVDLDANPIGCRKGGVQDVYDLHEETGPALLKKSKKFIHILSLVPY